MTQVDARRPFQLSTGLLTPSDRPVRRSLPVWARELLTTLDELPSRALNDGELSTLSWCAAQAALVEAHAGQLDAAADLSWRHVRWADALARRSGVASIVTLAAQPWINLGRLAALRGDVDDAMIFFAALLPAADGMLNLGGLRIAPDDWASVALTAHDATERMLCTHLLESVKSLLLGKRFGAALELMSSLRNAPAEVLPGLGESRLVALQGDGRFVEAETAASELLAGAAGWQKVVIRIRCAEAALLGARYDVARAWLASCDDALRRVDLAAQANLACLSIVQRALALRHAVDDGPAVSDVMERCIAGADRIGDEILMIDLLTLTAPLDERAGERLESLRSATLYARCRSKNAPARIDETVDALGRRIRLALT